MSSVCIVNADELRANVRFEDLYVGIGVQDLVAAEVALKKLDIP